MANEDKSGKMSAGVLPYRFVNEKVEVMLAHLGGPFFAKNDLGSWVLVKGEFGNDEKPIDAARREFKEETSFDVDLSDALAVPPFKQKNGKVVYAFIIESDFDVTKAVSNKFEIEWPPKSGRRQQFPEVDRVEWFDLEKAREKMRSDQLTILDFLEVYLEQNGK